MQESPSSRHRTLPKLKSALPRQSRAQHHQFGIGDPDLPTPTGWWRLAGKPGCPRTAILLPRLFEFGKLRQSGVEALWG